MQPIESLIEQINQKLTDSSSCFQMEDFELGYRLSVVNSERRIMQLGCVGVLSELDGLREAKAAHADYIELVPGIERFYGVANFVLDMQHTPSGFVEVATPTGTSSSESQLTLTHLGKSNLGLAGDLLDLSYRRNISLRDLLGKTHNDPVEDPNDPPYNTQEKLLSLGTRMSISKQWATTQELLDLEIHGVSSIPTLEGILRSWESAGLVVRQKDDKRMNTWQFSDTGRDIYRDLLEILARHVKRDPENGLQGELLLNDYLTDPVKKRYAPLLFRRDYIATGGRTKAKIDQMATAIEGGVQHYAPGTIVTTGEIADILGRDLNVKELYRLVWWLGSSSVLRLHDTDVRRTYWEIIPKKRPSDLLG